MWIIRVTMWIMRAIKLLPKSPDPEVGLAHYPLITEDTLHDTRIPSRVQGFFLK